MTQPAEFEALLTALRGAGEETRLRILLTLTEGELAVTELTQVLGQSQPRISRHLKLLQEAGLIVRRREGAWAFFSLTRGGFGADLAAFLAARADWASGDLAEDRRRRSEVAERRRAAAAAYFAEHAGEWDRLSAMHAPEQAVEAAARGLLAPQNGGKFARLIDLGAGSGRMLEAFSNSAAVCVGYDLSGQMLTAARGRIAAAGLRNIELRQADILRLPESDGAADAAICCQVLHFLSDPGAAIIEAARVLAPGGQVLIIDFAPHGLEELRASHAHRRLGFGAEEIWAMTQAAGLTLTGARSIPPPTGAAQNMLTVSAWLAQKRSV